MAQLDYEEFDLQLDRAGKGYTVRVVGSPTGPTAAVPFKLPGTPETLKLLVLTLRAVRGVRALETDTAPDAKKYGGELFNAVFHDDVLSALRGSLHVASTMDRGLRVRLRFTDPSVLANVPWELMYDTVRHRFLCQYGKYPVVRYIEIPEPVTPLKVKGPVRMLVVISAPRDYPEIDTEQEWERLLGVLKPLVETGRLQVDRLPKASLAAIHRALLEDEYHVFHYIGHGGVDPKTGDGVLALTGPDGLSRLESGHDLGVMLSNSPIRLVVLNSCEGARISEVDPYAGTAISLVQQGIPAVVAMQFEITDEAAFAFSSTLYDGITDGRPIDLAVTLARQAILATSRSEWATPVLYLRTSDGVIFDISTPPIPATPPVPPPPKPEALPVPPPAPAPPPAPVGLTATVVGRRDVDLRWEVPEEGALPMVWEVRRDGVAVTETTVPAATDVVPGPGSYTYTVVSKDDEGRASPPSEPISVTVEAPQPTPAPPPPAGTRPFVPVALPGRPDLLVARAVGRRVQLEWGQPEDPSAPPVDHWEVIRDGTPIGRAVGAPEVIDEHPGKGRHAYAVSAVGADGGRSAPSDEMVVMVGGRPRAWVALLLVPLLAGMGWYFFIRDGSVQDGRPAQPVGLEVQVTGLQVKLDWEMPSSSSPRVREWRILRSGEQVAIAPTNTYTETVTKAGVYSYSVVAVGENGLVSDRSAPVAATATTTTPPIGLKADLRTRFTEPPDPGATQIALRVNSLSGVDASNVRVTVRSDVPGTLLRVLMARTPCVPRGDTPVCVVGRIPAHGLLSMTVFVDRGREAFTLTASAESDTPDPDPTNNSDRLRLDVSTSSPVTSTNTSTPSPDATTTQLP